MDQSPDRIDVLERQLKDQAAAIQVLQKTIRQGRRGHALLALKLRIFESGIKKKNQAVVSDLDRLGFEVHVFKKFSVQSDGRQDVCREERNGLRAKFRRVHDKIQKLEKKVRSIKLCGSDATESGFGAAGERKGKGKQMRRIIKEHGKHCRLISQLQKDLEMVKSSRSAQTGRSVMGKE